MAKGKAIDVIGYECKKDLGMICKKAETLGIYNIESEKRGVAYMYALDEIAVVTCRGYIRMTLETAREIVNELSGIIEDIEDLKRMEVQI